MTTSLLIVIIIVTVIFGVIFLALICSRLLRTRIFSPDNHVDTELRYGERPLSVHTAYRTDNIPAQPGIKISSPVQDHAGHELSGEEADSDSVPEMYYLSVGNDGTCQAVL